MVVIKRLLVLLLVCLSVQASANHVLGGNLSYECLGGDTYGVTLTIYTDCFGATPAISQENVFFIPQAGCTLPFSVNLQLQSIVDVSDLCPSELANSSCNGGVNPGVEMVTYYEEVILDPACVWDVSWNGGDWNYFNNMDNALLPTAFFLTTIDATVNGCANSIVPQNTFPVQYTCAGDVGQYIPDIANPDGYDLTFSLVCPQIANGVDAPLTEPCDEPIPGITIDPLTGVIDYTAPGLFGNYVVGLEIIMEDAGNVVATMYHTVTIISQACVSTPTTFTTPEVQSVNDEANIVGPNAIEVCAGDSLCFTVEATNTNIFRAITVSSDFQTIFPDGDFSQSGINPAIAEFCLETDASMVGTTTVTIDAIDDACNNPSSDQITVDITVLPAVDINVADTLICFGETVDLTASGDTDFQWNVISGDADPGIVGNDPSQSLTPNETTVVELISINAGAGCNADTLITIEVALSQIDALLTNESCNGNDGAIDLTIDGAEGPYTFDWPTIPSISEDVTGLVGGDYNVTVTDAGLAGCTRDSIFTLTSDPPPSGSISGDITICEGECTDILFALNGTGPFAIQLRNSVTNALEAVPDLNDGEVFNVCPTETTTYTLEQITDSNNPQCDYTVISTVTVTVRPIPNASFLAVPVICNGEDANLELDIDQLGSYVVTYNPDGVPASPAILTDGDVVVVSPTVTTDYTITNIEYQDAPLCANTTVQTTQVVVNESPSIAAPTDDFVICNGDPLSIDLTFTGTGPWEFTHDYPGVASPVTANTANFTWDLAVPPVVSTTINISTDVLDNGTSCTSGDLTGLPITITVNALPTADVLDDQTICSDETATLEFDLTGATPFDVTWNDGTQQINEVGIDDGFLVNLNPTGSVNVCIEAISDANGCAATPNTCAALTEVLLASGNFAQANAAICAGECFDIPFVFANGTGPYDITIDETDDNGSTTQTITINDGDTYQVCPVGNYNAVITAVVDQASGCSVDFSAQATFDIAVTPISTVDMSGDATICNGDCADLMFTFTDEQGPLTLEVDGVVFAIIDPAVDLVGGVYIAQVCPAATTTYTLTAYIDAATTCTAVQNDAVTITVNDLPDASFVSDIAVCEGDAGSLEFDILNGPVDIELSIDDGGVVTNETLLNVADGDLYTATPAVTTTYTILSISDNGVPTECTASPNAPAAINVNTTPQVEIIDTLCTNTADAYQLVVNITLGDPLTYAVDVPGNIVQLDPATYQYTSDPLVPEDVTTFTFSDINSCGTPTITNDSFSCPILTFSGTVDVTPQGFCDNGIVETTHNGDEVLDPNDVLSFIIHSDPTNQLGIVYYVSDQPSWDITNDLDLPGTLQYGVEYYLSAVAGDDDGSGIVDLGAAGVSVSAGMPFTIVETPSATISGGATICEGETTDLTIDFTGTGDYTVAWAIDGVEEANSPVGPTADNPLIVTTGEAGDYTLLSVANEFCFGTTAGDATVVVNPLPTGTLSGGGTFCEGTSLDLTLDLTGTANWDVTIANDNDGDGIIDFTEVINVANANSFYTVADSLQWFIDEITDGNGCTNDTDGAQVVVEIDPLPTAQIAFGDTSFCEGSTFDLEVDLTGAGPWDVTYSIDGVPTTVTVAASPMLETIGVPGTICVDEVVDANGCTAFPAECIVATEIAIPLADAGPDVAYCTGSSVQIGTPNNPNYAYLWNNTDSLDANDVAQPFVILENTTGADEVFTLELTVSEVFCSATDQVDVTLHPLPIAEAGDSAFICFDAELILIASGGVTYQWEDNGAFTLGGLDQANPTVQPFQSDWFVVDVTDANNCSASDSVWVNVPEELIATIDSNGPLCFGACDGELAMIPSGGFAPYTYEWVEEASNDSLITDLCAGTYNYILTDSIGCTTTGAEDLLEQPEYFLDDVIITQPTCFGDETGALDVESATGVTFTLVESDVTNNLGIFPGLPAGTYNVFATDAQGCVADSTVTFTSVSDEITMTVDFDVIDGCVDDEVTFGAEALGGDGNFTYQWYGDTPPADPISTDNPYTTTIIETVNYSVVALDGNGCSSDTLLSTVQLPDSIFITAGPQSQIEICQGECLELTSEATGGGGPLQIEWVEITLTGDVVGTQNDLDVCPPNVNAIDYVVFASDGCAAAASDTIEVFLYEIPPVEFSVDTTSGCFPVTVTFTNTTNESFLDFCEWDFGDGNTQVLCGDITYTYAIPGEYFPSLSVTATSGCTFADTLDVPIVIHDYPTADFTWEPMPVTTLYNTVQYINESEDAVQFTWNFGGLFSSIEENPEVTLPPIDLNIYEACLIATSEFGCNDTICKQFVMDSELLIYVPNVFTPDQDGINEVFAPVIGGGITVDGYLFRVWDRWGDIVFESTEPGEGWNGGVKRGSYYTQNDVYIWDLTVRDIKTGELRNLKGDVTILR